MTTLDKTVNYLEFQEDPKDDIECSAPVIMRSELKEYLLQLREMKGFSLVGFVDTLPPEMKEVEVYSIITGGRNCQVEVNPDLGKADFRHCPFHIRFVTEYGGQWKTGKGGAGGASAELKKSMTRKFMDEPLRGTSLSQPRTALDYFYMMPVGEDLNPDPVQVLIKNRYDATLPKPKEKVKKPVFNVYLSHHNVSSNLDEGAQSFHNSIRYALANECYRHMYGQSFELHIVGIVTDFTMEESKSEKNDYAVTMRVPAFLVYIRELKKKGGSYKKTRQQMEHLIAAGHGMNLPELAQKFEYTEEELVKLFKEYRPELGMANLDVLTIGIKADGNKANVEDKSTTNTTVKPNKPEAKPETKPEAKPETKPEEKKVTKSEEKKAETKVEEKKAPSTLTAMRAKFNSSKVAAKVAAKTETNVDDIKNTDVRPTKPVTSTKKEKPKSTIERLNDFAEEADTAALAASGEVDLDNLDEGIEPSTGSFSLFGE